MPSIIKYLPVIFLLTLLAAGACSDDELADNAEPANMETDIRFEPEGSGNAIIEVHADNAVEYWLSVDEQDAETNTTGVFEHVFTQSGDYTLDVRAYGLSGRYLRKVFTLTVDIEEEEEDEVPVDQGYSTPLSYEGYELAWHDEFEGDEVNTDDWVFEIGDGCPDLCGWGNNESQYYREENAWVENDVLTIEAREEAFGSRNHTSARMKTQGKQSFTYGRIDIRALLPQGQGIWPALWMLGSNIETIGWPYCGEIDIMELIGGNGRDNEVHGTLHWYNNGHTFTGGSYTLSSGIFADEYHVFTIIWDETSIRWFVNDVQFHEILITPSHMSAFHEDHFFIFNVAVGGNWPGYPDETTNFPQRMKVDYIRVFQENQ